MSGQKIGVAIVGLIAVFVLGIYLKWGVPLSDYQRLNALEIRVTALESQ